MSDADGGNDGHYRQDDPNNNGGRDTPTIALINTNANDDAVQKLRDELASLREELFETKATLATVEAESDYKVDTARRKTEESVQTMRKEPKSSMAERKELSFSLAEVEKS